MQLRPAAFGIVLSLGLGACATAPVNPSFPLTQKSAKIYLREVRESRPALERPLVIINGFHDLGIPSFLLAAELRKTFGDDRILAVSIEGCRTFDQCRDKVITAVNRRFPSDNGHTVSVDVIGISMGGLVSRYAALPDQKPRLAIHRLFTIGTPHRGSRMAYLPAFESTQRDMRPGSEFLIRLSEAKRDYELFAYVRTRDELVRVEDAAPEGMTAWWAPHDGWFSAHGSSFLDRRFVADIVARLTGQPPFSTVPPASAH